MFFRSLLSNVVEIERDFKLKMFLIICISLVTALYFWYQVKYRHRNLLLAKLPAPKRTFIFHHTLLLIGKSPKEIFDVGLEMKTDYGSVFAFTLNPFDDGTVIVSDPKIAEVIMKSQKLLDKGLNYDPIRRWLGEGLLLSIDEKWHQRRKILTPAFHFQILEKFVEIMNDHGEVLVNKLAKFDGKVVDVFPLVNLYTLDVICGE